MPFNIPIEPSVAFQNLDMSLENYAFRMLVEWSARDNIDPATGEYRGAWYLSFYEDTNTPIITGCKVVNGTYIGRVCNHRLFRRGVFVVEDTGGEMGDPGFDNFGVGGRYQLRYYTAGDLAGNVIAEGERALTS